MDHQFKRGEVIRVLNSAEQSIAETYEIIVKDLLISEDETKLGYEVQVPSGRVFQVSEQRLLQLKAPGWKRKLQTESES